MPRDGRGGTRGTRVPDDRAVLATARSFTLLGLDAVPVEVEAHVQPGVPAFTLVGLPDKAVSEARERVRSGIASAELVFPLRRVTVNLAPATVRKEGAGFDLAIALAVLAATGQLPADRLAQFAALGELALDARLRPVPGAVVAAEAAGRTGLRGIICAPECAGEAALVAAVDAIPCPTLVDAVAFLRGGRSIEPARPPTARAAAPGGPDLADVQGQPLARRALEIAAAGAHNLLMVGPPGVGKTMLARRLPGILPPLTPAEAIETARIHSVAGLLPAGAPLPEARPFRAPHHSSSPASIVGGGPAVRPGEVTLAHNGVLFLDELPEFARNALEALRGPLEDGAVEVARVAGRVRLPAAAALVAAMNPCPCGAPDAGACSCPPGRIDAYRRKVSGPLLDRIDLGLRLARPSAAELRDGPGEPSAAVRVRVAAARARQLDRGLGPNARLAPGVLDRAAPLDARGESLLRRAVDRLRLSPRAVARAVRVARTIADLEGADAVAADHVAAARAFRLGGRA